jgi:myo-inositol 2-dehydrogenase/D-chiro-inositol 1-dehydrogenase
MTRYTEAYANEIAAFIAALASGTPPAPSGRDGLAALILAEAAVRSVADGRRVRVAEIAG